MQDHPSRSRLTRALSAVFALAGTLACTAALAQAPAAPAPKGIAEDSAAAIRSAFDAFGRWISGVGASAADAIAPPPPTIQPLPFSVTVQQAASTVPYEPAPVILGEPPIRLAGGVPGATPKGWGDALNYQGMEVKLLVLDASGKRHVVKPMSAPIRFGERFKLLVTPTFDAVATLDDVLGRDWNAQRGAQAYPAGSASVPLAAGQPTLLPTGANYFVADKAGARRFVLNVRHAKAVGDARSSQPAYRRDTAAASNYLQLVPKSTYPAFEQLLVAGSR